MSQVREKALNIVNRLEAVYVRYAQHKTIANIMLNFVRPHILNVLQNQIPENELKQILLECYGEIRPVANEMGLALELKDMREYNDIRTQKFVENIKEYHEALELIP